MTTTAEAPEVPWHLSTIGVLTLATLLTLVALAENTFLPWAPFHVVHATLATLIPIGWGTWSFGRLSTVRRSSWAFVVALPVVLQIGAGLWEAVIYPAVWESLGVEPEVARGPYYALSAALPAMFEAGAAHLGWMLERMQGIYLGLVFVWAGFGEEVFYRGYVQGVLRRRIGPLRATLTASAFFAVRHATQLALVRPYPLAAAFSWVVVGFAAGLALGWLYERSSSLWPPVVAHYLFNLIPLAALLLS